MKNKQIISIFIIALAIGLTFTSCKEKKKVISGEALFSYVANGFDVTFTNTSTVDGTYSWKFGDDATSTEKSPSHTYSSKGEYTVELTVTDENGDPHTVSTKIKVDKASPVKLDDSSFSDWDAIGVAFTPGTDAGIVNTFKYDYDGDNIYFYLKVDTDAPTSSQIFDMLVDLDPDATTGYTYTLWPDFGGAELLIENSFSNDRENEDAYWLSFANYDANGTDWDTYWIYDSNATNPITDGTYLATGTVIEIEFSISRVNIPSLVGKDKIKVVAWTSNPDWDENGWMPDKATAENPTTDGIIIDMQ